MAGVTGKINHPVMCVESVYGSVSHWVAGKVIFMQLIEFVNNLGSSDTQHLTLHPGKPQRVTTTPKTRCKFSTTNFGSYVAVFCLVMDRQFLLFKKSCALSFEF